jgi:hypothetical protein
MRQLKYYLINCFLSLKKITNVLKLSPKTIHLAMKYLSVSVFLRA